MSTSGRLQDTPPERVVGFEMEYSPSIKYVDLGTNATVASFHAGDQLLSEILSDQSVSQNGFKDDGFRAYGDCQMAEVCTPESYPDDVGILQLVSESMAIDGLHSIASRLADYVPAGERVDFLLPLRVAKGGFTSGFHENYQVLDFDLSKEYPHSFVFQFLELYRATGACWMGQGYFGDIKNFFRIAQKTSIIGQTGGGVRTNQAEYATIPESYRYEIQDNDYPTTHWQLMFRAAYTSAVIRALELKQLGSMNFKHIFDREKTSIEFLVAQDPFLPIRQLGYKNAIEWQLELCETVVSAAETSGYPDYELTAAKEIARVLSELKSRNYSNIALAVPWVLKYCKLKPLLSSLSDADETTDLLTKGRQICVAMDSHGHGSALDRIRARDYRYDEKDVAKVRFSKTRRLKLARNRGQNIADFAKRHPELTFNAEWMTDKVLLEDGG